MYFKKVLDQKNKSPPNRSLMEHNKWGEPCNRPERELQLLLYFQCSIVGIYAQIVTRTRVPVTYECRSEVFDIFLYQQMISQYFLGAELPNNISNGPIYPTAENCCIIPHNVLFPVMFFWREPGHVNMKGRSMERRASNVVERISGQLLNAACKFPTKIFLVRFFCIMSTIV